MAPSTDEEKVARKGRARWVAEPTGRLGGRLISADIRAGVPAKTRKQPYKRRTAEAEARSIRMGGDGGPAQPSPTVRSMPNGGLTWLEVECNRCKTRAEPAAQRCPRDTSIWKLKGGRARARCPGTDYQAGGRVQSRRTSGRSTWNLRVQLNKNRADPSYMTEISMDQRDDPEELERKIAQASRLANRVSDQTTIGMLSAWIEELKQTLQRHRERRRLRDETRKRAQDLWERAGRPSGRDVEFWLQAESEIKSARRATD